MTTSMADKITKLLSKAESTTPEEAEALVERAQYLMIKYSIEAAEIDERKRADGQATEEIITASIVLSGRWAMQHRSLLGTIIFHSDGIQGYLSLTGKPNGACIYYMVGYKSHVEQVKRLCESVLIQSVVALRKFTKEHPLKGLLSGSEMWREGKGFLMGYSRGIGTRLSRAQQEVKQEGGSTELVLARDARVSDWVRTNVGPLGKARGSSTSSSSYARESGHAEGMNANTGGAEVGGKRTQIN